MTSDAPFQVERETLELIPLEWAVRWRCLPLKVLEDGGLLMAALDPYNSSLLERLESHTGRSISSQEASEVQIATTLEVFFGPWVMLLERYDSQGSYELDICPEDFEA